MGRRGPLPGPPGSAALRAWAKGRHSSSPTGSHIATSRPRCPFPWDCPRPCGTPRWGVPRKRHASSPMRSPAPVPLRSTPALTEIAQGEWEGHHLSVVRERWAKELAAWRRTPATSHAPGGESLRDAAERVRTGLAEIVASLGDNAAPTGGRDRRGALRPGARLRAGRDDGRRSAGALGAGSCTRRHLPVEPINLLGLPLERFWSFPFNLASITVVTLHSGAAALRAHNLSEHLAPLAIEERAAAESRGDRRGAL